VADAVIEADFLKNQVADMGLHGPFIEKLRSGWKLFIDDRRGDPSRLTQFRLTLVAGMKDRFVPSESALKPFPFDEQCWVPGNHVGLVKPKSREDLIYAIVRDRLTRSALTAAERGLIYGESEMAVAAMNCVRAAMELGDTETLFDLADELKQNTARMPRVERELGLALLEAQAYPLAVEMLQRYLAFQMPDGQQPFKEDVQAIQQLAIALSGTGDIVGAVTQLRALEPQIQNDPETQGILAGRFKRQWLKNPTAEQIGWRALQLYRSAFEVARSQDDYDQTMYNGINAAYMNFALGATDYTILADEVLAACQARSPADYWTDAARAEAYLLLRRYAEADQAYGDALRHAPSPRWWGTMGQQALDLIKRQGNPSEASAILSRFASIKLDI
jgi:tetratricopeptide (TPR) repeat protein